MEVSVWKTWNNLMYAVGLFLVEGLMAFLFCWRFGLFMLSVGCFMLHVCLFNKSIISVIDIFSDFCACFSLTLAFTFT